MKRLIILCFLLTTAVSTMLSAQATEVIILPQGSDSLLTDIVRDDGTINWPGARNFFANGDFEIDTIPQFMDEGHPTPCSLIITDRSDRDTVAFSLSFPICFFSKMQYTNVSAYAIFIDRIIRDELNQPRVKSPDYFFWEIPEDFVVDTSGANWVEFPLPEDVFLPSFYNRDSFVRDTVYEIRLLSAGKLPDGRFLATQTWFEKWFHVVKSGISTSVEFVEAVPSFRIFPNPIKAGNSFLVSSVYPKSDIVLFDFTGRPVRSFHGSNEQPFSTVGIVPGVYQLVLMAPGGQRQHNQKIMIYP